MTWKHRAETRSMSSNSSGAFGKSICSICYEDLDPILEDLLAISICGHVFYELCLQQWLEYCPAGKKSSCPVYKQFCSQKNICRLYFQSMGDPSTQTTISSPKPSDADAEALRQEVKKLERKIIAQERKILQIDKSDVKSW